MNVALPFSLLTLRAPNSKEQPLIRRAGYLFTEQKPIYPWQYEVEVKATARIACLAPFSFFYQEEARRPVILTSLKPNDLKSRLPTST